MRHIVRRLIPSPLRPLARALYERVVERRPWRGHSELAELGDAVGTLALDHYQGQLIPVELVPYAARALLRRGEALSAYRLLEERSTLTAIDLPTRRQLWAELHSQGYLRHALMVADACVAERAGWRYRSAAVHLRGEIAVLGDATEPAVRIAPPRDYRPVAGRVLHVVGTSLPFNQVGYTLRTHYIATAQAASGLDPHVVTHMGYATERFGGSRQVVDGVTYHRIAGPPRGALPLDRWVALHTERVARLVARLRPAVLHAASDYLNALAAGIIGNRFGIPVVYESRGFWEETWLSRQARRFGWDTEELAATQSLPDTYLWRRDIEDRCRRRADRVVTLAEGMAERIVSGGVDPSHITVIPNAVDVDAFPVQTRSRQLADRLGITDDTIVIGYISSIVEYEGIDTLIQAYAAIHASAPTPVALLIVGDGPERGSLMGQAAELGVAGATFTGRVPHEEILDYYGLIDIFVVPRRPVEVCHLVTPLKPFEAFATGRTVVLSDVRALATIAHESQAAELFTAGSAESLATVLTALLDDEARRKQLASAGSDWVRTHRTWAANAAAYRRLYAELAPRRATVL